MSPVQIAEGFSLTNRWLLYTSFMLSPAQFLSGLGSDCPSNLGFLAYNWYSQIVWYQAIKAKQMHALSLMTPYFNLIYAISFLGGITSGNIVFGGLLCLGTAGVLLLNTVSAWTSWATNQPEGIGEYQFFFFGWQTLSTGWHSFFLLWQIFDTINALFFLSVGIGVAVLQKPIKEKVEKDFDGLYLVRWLYVPFGGAVMLFFFWPFIMWTELTASRNHIESHTDFIAVGLFGAQVVALFIPSLSGYLGCFKGIFPCLGPRKVSADLETGVELPEGG
ncbi:hypothetical protein MKZ38_001089 [Zalerion maritima]|uniref:Uncharacterized protein n=1 Tax=Zalerion maritima TaxID=339359 RepID=A0AAD5RYH4_9PEZI|nr:hypothetical protein MKZ38_001089 [Zalerion maritima]